VAGFLAFSGLGFLSRKMRLPIREPDSDALKPFVLITVAETASESNGIPYYLVQKHHQVTEIHLWIRLNFVKIILVVIFQFTSSAIWFVGGDKRQA